MRGETALVTGGNGFLGRSIVRQLLVAGVQVRTLARTASQQLTELGVDQRLGDLRRPHDVVSATQGCDVVFHVAAKAGVWGPRREFEEINIEGTRHILDACRATGIRRLVHTSSPSVTFDGSDQAGVDESAPYPARFHSDYPRTKAIAEQLVLAANSPELATVALRPHLIWGPGDPHLIPRLVQRARAGRLRRIGTIDHRVDAVFVENAATAHLQAATVLSPDSPVAGKAYFITNDEPVSLWTFLNDILRIHGGDPIRRTISPRIAYGVAVGLEQVWSLFRLPDEPPLTRFVVRQLATSHWFNIAAAKRDFGYAPAISMSEGLRRLAEYVNSPSR